MSDRPGVTIALPAYNEEATLESVTLEALDVLGRLAGECEVLIVDDGSADRTPEVADRLAREHPRVRVVHHERNRGFSGAMRSCLWGGRCEWVFLAPADKQARLDDLAVFLAQAERHDMLFSYRVGREDSRLRKLGSLVWYGYLRLLFGVAMPEFSSTFLFKREVLHALEVPAGDRTVNMLPMLFLLSRRAGYRVGLVGTVQHARAAGTSKGGSLSNALRTMAEDLVLWRQVRRSPRPRGRASTARQG